MMDEFFDLEPCVPVARKCYRGMSEADRLKRAAQVQEEYLQIMGEADFPVPIKVRNESREYQILVA